MSGLFAPDVAPPPTPKPPAPMPDQSSLVAREASRRAQMDIMGRAGRTSTILTAPSSRSDYTGTKLGTGA